MNEIAKRRTELKLRQADIAERARVSPSMVSAVERGMIPTTKVMKALAEAYETTEELLWPQRFTEEYMGRPATNPHAPRRDMYKHLTDAGEEATRR